MGELKGHAMDLKAEYERIEKKVVVAFTKPFTSFADRLAILEQIVDCYFNIISRLLIREKIDKSKDLLASVYATIEKIEPQEKNATHGMILKHYLYQLKIIRAEIRKIRGGNRYKSDLADELIKTGIQITCDGFRLLLKKKEQVQHFFVGLECLAYFCYFSIESQNVSQTYQYATVIKSLIESFMTKIDSDDKNNLLVEVMIFCKKHGVHKDQRFDLYRLLVTALILYATALRSIDQFTKSQLYFDKVIILLQTIEPDSPFLEYLETIRSQITYSKKENTQIDNRREQLEVRVTHQDPELSKAEPIDEGSSQENNDEQSEERILRRRKKLFGEKKSKMYSLSNGLFIRGFAGGKIGEETFNKYSEKWILKRNAERERSLKQTLNKEYSKIASSPHPPHKRPNDAHIPPQSSLKNSYNEPSNQGPKENDSNHKHMIQSVLTLQDLGGKVDDQEKLNYKGSMSKLRPGTAVFGNKKSNIVHNRASSNKTSVADFQSLGVSQHHHMRRSSMQIDNFGKSDSVYFIDNKAKNQQRIEESKEGSEVRKKPKSIAKQLQNLLYKAELREQMPDKYTFDKHKENRRSTAGGKQNKWTHEKLTTKESDNLSMNISKDWFYDRMMASRPRLDDNRVMTNNQTMNIKNHQVMIEFKTGEHEEPPPPKKRAHSAYQQKTFLIKCSYTGENKEAHVKKGVPLGYKDHQFEERKKAYVDISSQMDKNGSNHPSANISKIKSKDISKVHSIRNTNGSVPDKDSSASHYKHSKHYRRKSNKAFGHSLKPSEKSLHNSSGSNSKKGEAQNDKGQFSGPKDGDRPESNHLFNVEMDISEDPSGEKDDANQRHQSHREFSKQSVNKMKRAINKVINYKRRLTSGDLLSMDPRMAELFRYKDPVSATYKNLPAITVCLCDEDPEERQHYSRWFGRLSRR